MSVQYLPGETRTRVLDVIKDNIAKRGFPPTVREIRDAVGLSSTSVVGYYLKQLEAEGKIVIEFGKSRGITVIEDGHGRYSGLVNRAWAVVNEPDDHHAVEQLRNALEALR